MSVEHRLFFFISATIGFVLLGCDRQPVAPPPPSPPEVEVVQLTPVAIPMTFEFVGRTASSRRVEIRARVSGYLDEIAYTEGARVKEGDTLFRIDPAPFEAQLRAARAEMAQQQARLETAQSLLSRVEPLAEADAVSQKELDDARGRFREAAAAVEGAAARVHSAELNLGYTTITSPVSGVSGQSAQREGAYISGPAGPLTYVAQIDPIWVEFSVSETQILRFRKSSGDGVVVYPENGAFEVAVVLADGSPHPYTGRISFADATIDKQTGTFLVRAEIPNPEDTLSPGQYVRVLIRGAYRPDAIAVPQRAVRQGPRGATVWVVDVAGKAELRPVITGPWLGDLWIIEDGLEADDRLIVNGSFGLSPGVAVSIVGIVRTDPVLERAGG